MAKGMRDELKYNTYAKHSALNMCMCILTNIRYTIHVRMITERKGERKGNNTVNPNLSGFHVYI